MVALLQKILFIRVKLIFPYIIGNRYDGKVYNLYLSITFIDQVILSFKMYYIQSEIKMSDDKRNHLFLHIMPLIYAFTCSMFLSIRPQ